MNTQFSVENRTLKREKVERNTVDRYPFCNFTEDTYMKNEIKLYKK